MYILSNFSLFETNPKIFCSWRLCTSFLSLIAYSRVMFVSLILFQKRVAKSFLLIAPSIFWLFELRKMYPDFLERSRRWLGIVLSIDRFFRCSVFSDCLGLRMYTAIEFIRCLAVAWIYFTYGVSGRYNITVIYIYILCIFSTV